MKIAYFDCFSGASGNMILGALVDAGLDSIALQTELAKLSLDEYELHFDKRVKHAISATHLEVIPKDGVTESVEPGKQHSHDHGHKHGTGDTQAHSHHDDDAPDTKHEHGPSRHLADILTLIENSGLSASVKQKAARIFDRLTEAEARIHGKRKEEVHLHEVSAIDSIVDVVGSVVGLELLGIEQIHVSPIAVGTGFVRCEHGVMPIPAPGTLELLKGVPVKPTDIPKELTTPTGAAILTTLATGFGPMPEMTVDLVGYGAGTRDLAEQPNLLRVCIGSKKKR